MSDAERIDLIVGACREVQARIEARGNTCDDFTLERIGMRFEWAIFAGVDINTAIEQIAAKYVPSDQQAA